MNVDSSNLEARLIAARSNLQTLQSTHGDASLALARGEADDAELDALEEEIRSAEKVIRRLEAAAAARAEADTEAFREAQQRARQEARKQVDTLGAQMEALALEMVALVEGLGPLLAQFDAMSRKRRAAAADAIRFQTASPAKAERALARVVAHAALREGAVPAALLAALWRSGLTRVFSTEAIGAILPPPDFYTPYGKGDVREALKQSLAGLRSQLDAHLDQLQKEQLQ